MSCSSLDAATAHLRSGKTDASPAILNKSCKDWAGKYLGLQQSGEITCLGIVGASIHLKKKKKNLEGQRERRGDQTGPFSTQQTVFVLTQLGSVSFTGLLNAIWCRPQDGHQ